MIRANHRVNTTRSESRVIIIITAAAVVVDNASRQCYLYLRRTPGALYAPLSSIIDDAPADAAAAAAAAVAWGCRPVFTQ